MLLVLLPLISRLLLSSLADRLAAAQVSRPCLCLSDCKAEQHVHVWKAGFACKWSWLMGRQVVCSGCQTDAAADLQLWNCMQHPVLKPDNPLVDVVPCMSAARTWLLKRQQNTSMIECMPDRCLAQVAVMFVSNVRQQRFQYSLHAAAW